MRLIFLALVVTSIINSASAQTSTISLPDAKSRASTSTTQDPFKAIKSGYAAQGLRVSIFKPNYDMKIDINTPGLFMMGQPDVDSGNGLFVGYAYLPVQSFGFIGGANYIEMVSNDRSANTLRLEANGAFAFTQNFYAKIGLNNTRLVSKGAGQFDAGMGHQLGLGMQISKNIGLDLTYSEAKMSLNQDIGFGVNLDADVKIYGTELGLTGTF